MHVLFFRAMSAKPVVYVDEKGRFLAIEGVNDGYVIESKKHKKCKKEHKWNKKEEKPEEKKEEKQKKKCAKCKVDAVLQTRCDLCNENIYCSRSCQATDSTHAIVCASKSITTAAPVFVSQTKQPSGYGSRFVAWSAEFGGKPKYNAIMYPHYRKWYRDWPTYATLEDAEAAQVAGVVFPKISSKQSAHEITMKMRELRIQNAAMRRRTGYEIMPNPADGEFIWIKPVTE